MTYGRRMRIVVAAGLLGLGAVSARAQEPRPERHGGERKGERREERRERREEMFKMVDAYVAMHVEEELDLTDEQFARVLPLIRRLHADRRSFAERRFHVVGQIRDRLASGSATEAQLTRLVKEARTIEEDEPATLRKDREAIDQVLTVVQQAKYRVLEMQIERRIRELIHRGRDGARRDDD